MCIFILLLQNSVSANNQKDTSMRKLQREIALNNAKVINNSEKKQERKVLVENLMDSVSGGWVNVFARWDKAI
ncbi:conserved protein of unknown function [Xenorhabdus bovienii]|uniref:Uncharacterized protein n=2 Tax=Xenorhabdus bovienii TaxID=40576 RepID=A0A0B6XF00_XENBV|nr:conserved protein of unknown function [Xenorhabdus bovienii]